MKGTLLESLGMKIVEISEEKVVMTMPVDDRTKQPFGFLHGGASVALAETVASIGTGNLIDTETHSCFGLEINANHLHSVREGTVTATGVPVHKGKSTMVWTIEVRDELDRLLCISRCTVAIKEKRK